MSSTTTLIENLISAYTSLKQYFEGVRSDIDQRVLLADQQVSSFLDRVQSVGYIETENDAYKTIARFRSQYLVSSFRLTIAGTYNGFVYGGIFDVVCSHAGHLEVVDVVSSAYGSISMQVLHDGNGNGSIAIRRATGAGGTATMKITLTPYAGTAVVDDGAMDAYTNSFEQTYA